MRKLLQKLLVASIITRVFEFFVCEILRLASLYKRKNIFFLNRNNKFIRKKWENNDSDSAKKDWLEVCARRAFRHKADQNSDFNPKHKIWVTDALLIALSKKKHLFQLIQSINRQCIIFLNHSKMSRERKESVHEDDVVKRSCKNQFQVAGNNLTQRHFLLSWNAARLSVHLQGHRNRKYYSPELSSSHSGYESEYSETEEFYGMGCVNRETTHNSRSKLPAPKPPVGDTKYHKKRSRKKKRGVKAEEDHSHPLYPSFLERPPSRNGVNFALDSPYRNMDPIPARKSMENMPGFSDLSEIKCLKKPKKLPPIDKENRGHQDEYPFVMKHFWSR